MPSLPNPYGPATQIGEGLHEISNAIFNMGRTQAYGRYARQRSEAQEAEDLAQAEVHRANMRKLEEETKGLEQSRLASSPEAVLELGAHVSGLDQATFKRALDTVLNVTPAVPEGQAPVAITPAQIEAARRGRIAGIKHQADPKGNFNELMKALMTHQQTRDYVRAMSGELPVDLYGDVTAAAEGKSRYGMESGIQYSTQRQGQTYTTPLGQAKIGSEKNLQNLRRDQAEEADARTSKLAADKLKTTAETEKINKGLYGPETTVMVNGVAVPRFLGQVAGDPAAVSAPKPTAGSTAKGTTAEKRKPLSNGERTAMDNHLADIVGTRFDKIDPKTRASILAHAYELAVDPGSDWHRNPLGAVEEAVGIMAPEGFEDAAGMFASARFVPKGGLRPAPLAPSTSPGSSSPPASGVTVRPPAQSALPEQARARLREGVATKFGNGQTWMLKNGVPVQVR